MLETKNGKLYINDKEVLKGWESFSGWYWFATELNDDGRHFGFVQGHYDEWGYFSQQEIESLGNRVWEIRSGSLPHAGRRD
jgi:hypothetical protein